MGDWWLGLPGTAQGAVISVVLLPYVGILTGQLVPRWVVTKMLAASETMTNMWKGLYTDSEGVRVRAVEAMESGASAIEDAALLVKSTLEPLRKQLHDDAP